MNLGITEETKLAGKGGSFKPQYGIHKLNIIGFNVQQFKTGSIRATVILADPSMPMKKEMEVTTLTKKQYPKDRVTFAMFEYPTQFGDPTEKDNNRISAINTKAKTILELYGLSHSVHTALWETKKAEKEASDLNTVSTYFEALEEMILAVGEAPELMWKIQATAREKDDKPYPKYDHRIVCGGGTFVVPVENYEESLQAPVALLVFDEKNSFDVDMRKYNESTATPDADVDDADEVFGDGDASDDAGDVF